MNTQAGQHHNPAMLAALQQQQQQQQQQHGHGQMNPNMMNPMAALNGMGGMNPTQQQQLQQMLAAKYQGAGMAMAMGGGGANAGGFNPQLMQQYQQQHQGGGGGAGGSMGVNPQALMNMGGMNMGGMGMGGMNGRGSMGNNAGFNPQMLAQQQQFNQSSGRPGTGGGVNPQMLMQQHSGGGGGGMGGQPGMNNMSNGGGMNNMAGMNGGMMGMGGMGMGGMGGINPQALSMGANTNAGECLSPIHEIWCDALSRSRFCRSSKSRLGLFPTTSAHSAELYQPCRIERRVRSAFKYGHGRRHGRNGWRRWRCTEHEQPPAHPRAAPTAQSNESPRTT